MILTFVAALVAATLATAGGVYWAIQHYSEGLPSVATLKAGYRPPQVTRILARDETLLASVFTERRTVIPFEQVPDSAKLAFLAAEDAYFYEHEGVNYLGLARAFVANVRAGRTVQGGSTITQQVVKNVLLDSERSFARKIRELILSWRLEKSLTKDEILWLYLNHIYLGHGRYGIEEASRYYFGKHSRELLLDEAATLAGLVAAPERFSPRKDREKSLARRSYVLEQMVQKGFVTPELRAEVAQRTLRLAPAEETVSQLAPEMVDYSKRMLESATSRTEGGFSVRTALDPELQSIARKAVRSGLDAYMARHRLQPPYVDDQRKAWSKPHSGQPQLYRVYTARVAEVHDEDGTVIVDVGTWRGRIQLADQPRYNPKGEKASNFTRPGALLRVSLLEPPGDDGLAQARLELGPQAALVAIDARTREVVALVGNYEALSGGLDRATQAKRQPGSTFKTFVYSYGLHARRLTPATLLPVSHRGHGVPPQGPLRISVRDALAHSNNEAATVALQRVGAKPVVDWAHQLGIQSRLEADVSLALGSYEVSLLELTNAYATLANGGIFSPPKLVLGVDGPDDAPTDASPSLADEVRVMTPEEAYLTTDLLRSVVEVGTGLAARGLGRAVAGKTGTTNQEKDAWFVGYTTDIVAGVWVGYDDAMPLGRGESGAKAALPIWTEFMKGAHTGKPAARFVRPTGLLSLSIDPTTGLLPRPGSEGAIVEEFLAGTEPTEVSPPRTDAGVP